MEDVAAGTPSEEEKIQDAKTCDRTEVHNEMLEAALGLKDSDMVRCTVSKWNHNSDPIPWNAIPVGGKKHLIREFVVAQRGDWTCSHY